VRHAPLVTESASLGSRADAFHARSVVGQRLLDVEVIDVHVQTLLLAEVVRVLYRRTQHLLHQRRDTLLGKGHCLQCFAYAAAFDQIEHQPRLLRRHALVARFSSKFLCLLHSLPSLPSIVLLNAAS
jgi:hypothetical protein